MERLFDELVLFHFNRSLTQYNDNNRDRGDSFTECLIQTKCHLQKNVSMTAVD